MMEDKFDAEFKKKVKGIYPEIPDVVRFRVNDTLASLPEKRNWRKPGYLSAIAALFLICFVGIRYMYPMQLNKKSAAESPQNMAIATADEARAGDTKAQDNYTMSTDGAKEDNTAENANGGASNTMLKAAVPQTQLAEVGKTADTNIAQENDVKITLTANDGKVAVDQGIQLVLKTAIYDGKEIRIEFDKSVTNGVTYAGVAGEQVKAADSNEKVESILKSARVNVIENYDVRIVVNNIPLKCSVNVIETPQGENQYSGTMIIIPDSGLPKDLDIILSFDKIGDISGQWLLNTQISKQ